MSRATFAKISSEMHPLATGTFVQSTKDYESIELNSDDLKIAEEILAIHKKIYQFSSASGEWKWINQNKKRSYFEILEKGESQSLARLLVNFFRNEAVYGLISSNFESLNSIDMSRELESQILLDLDSWREFTDQDDSGLSILDMPRVGNPYGFLNNGILISVDQPRHDYFAKKIKDLCSQTPADRPRILEIGGGYGGLCLQLFRNIDNLCYINCDLPETLYIAYYFLRKSLNKKIVWALDGDTRDIFADIILVPAINGQKISPVVDVIFNSNSLSEMAKETVVSYMDLLHNLQPTYFLHQNSNFVLFPNSPRHIEVIATSFPIDKNLYHEVYRAISPWQGAGGRYREFLYKKINNIE